MRTRKRNSRGKELVMCSGIRFTDDEGNMYFARNLDWNCGYGQKVTVTPRGYERHYAFGSSPGRTMRLSAHAS